MKHPYTEQTETYFRKGDTFVAANKTWTIKGIWYIGYTQIAYDIISNEKEYYVTKKFLQKKGVL